MIIGCDRNRWKSRNFRFDWFWYGFGLSMSMENLIFIMKPYRSITHMRAHSPDSNSLSNFSVFFSFNFLTEILIFRRSRCGFSDDGFHVYKVIKAIKCLKFPLNFSPTISHQHRMQSSLVSSFIILSF